MSGVGRCNRPMTRPSRNGKTLRANGNLSQSYIFIDGINQGPGAQNKYISPGSLAFTEKKYPQL